MLDSAGTWGASAACLRSGGRLVVFGGTASTTAELDVRGFYFKQIDVVGHDDGQPRRLPGTPERLRDADLDADRRLRAPARRGRAMRSRRMSGGEQFGKLVLTT